MGKEVVRCLGGGGGFGGGDGVGGFGGDGGVGGFGGGGVGGVLKEECDFWIGNLEKEYGKED